MRDVYRKGLAIGWALAATRKNPSNDLECSVCGKLFKRRGSRKATAKTAVCCSIACKAKFQRGRHTHKPKTGPVISCKTCGKKVQRPPSQTGKYCSQLCRFKDPSFSDAIRGSNHYGWRGGVTPENQKQRTSAEGRAWRIAIFKRDKYKCQACGKGGRLHAHHIHSWAENHEIRFSPSNGIALCHDCHNTVHFYIKAVSKLIKIWSL